jgi:hypothetical protein
MAYGGIMVVGRNRATEHSRRQSARRDNMNPKGRQLDNIGGEKDA